MPVEEYPCFHAYYVRLLLHLSARVRRLAYLGLASRRVAYLHGERIAKYFDNAAKITDLDQKRDCIVSCKLLLVPVLTILSWGCSSVRLFPL